jgi:hypothetical protein
MGSCSGFRVYWITAHAGTEVKVQWVLAQGLLVYSTCRYRSKGPMGSCSGFRVYWIRAHTDVEVKVQWVLVQGLGFIGLQHNICNN